MTSVRWLAIGAVALLSACSGGGSSSSPSPNQNPSPNPDPTPPTPTAPTVSLTASAPSVPSGGAATLTWTSTDATSCTASGDWVGAKATAGSDSTGALTSAKSYTLACTGAGGTATQTVGVSVAPVVNRSVTVSWLLPTANADGTPLSDLQGFYVRYGTRAGVYSNVVDVADASRTSQVIDNLSPGTYYFVVSAYDTLRNESAYSIEVNKTL